MYHLSILTELLENRAVKMMKTSINGMRVLIYPKRKPIRCEFYNFTKNCFTLLLFRKWQEQYMYNLKRIFHVLVFIHLKMLNQWQKYQNWSERSMFCPISTEHCSLLYHNRLNHIFSKQYAITYSSSPLISMLNGRSYNIYFI